MKDLKTIQEFFSKPLEEAMGGELDEQLFIKVSSESKTTAYQIYINNGYVNIDASDLNYIKRYGSKFGSDVYASNGIEVIYDFYYDLVAADVVVEDENVTDIDYDLEEDSLRLKEKLNEFFSQMQEMKGVSKYLVSPENPEGETQGLTSDEMSNILMKIAKGGYYEKDKEGNLNKVEYDEEIPEIIKKTVKEVLLEKKKKRDRCLKIADRKFDKPSAYKSGAVTRCRDGEIWKGLKEASLEEKQKETLRTWFKRQGAPGKTGGWVDCNSPIYKDGKKVGYKPCGRKKGETRSQYPACRPTAAKCSDSGKGTKWGKTK
jgi:hypothetical protein